MAKKYREDPTSLHRENRGKRYLQNLLNLEKKFYFSKVFSKQIYKCVLHSDQGFQYAYDIYKDTPESLGVTISHSRKGIIPDAKTFFLILNLNCSISNLQNWR